MMRALLQIVETVKSSKQIDRMQSGYCIELLAVFRKNRKLTRIPNFSNLRIAKRDFQKILTIP